MITADFKVHNLNELYTSKQLFAKIMMRVYRFLLRGNVEIGKYDKETTDKLKELLGHINSASDSRLKPGDYLIPPIKGFAVDYAKAAIAVTKEQMKLQFSCRRTLYLSPQIERTDDDVFDKYERDIDFNNRLNEIYNFCIRLMIEEMIESDSHQVSELLDLRNLMVQTRIMLGDEKTTSSIIKQWGVNPTDPVEKFIMRVFDAVNYVAVAIEKQGIRDYIKANGLTDSLLEQYDDIIKTYSHAKAVWENPNTPF